MDETVLRSIAETFTDSVKRVHRNTDLACLVHVYAWINHDCEENKDEIL